MVSEPLDPVEPLKQAERHGGVRAWLNALDLSTYRAVRSLARDKRRVAVVRRFSKLGEHGALWLAVLTTVCVAFVRNPSNYPAYSHAGRAGSVGRWSSARPI